LLFDASVLAVENPGAKHRAFSGSSRPSSPSRARKNSTALGLTKITFSAASSVSSMDCSSLEFRGSGSNIGKCETFALLSDRQRSSFSDVALGLSTRKCFPLRSGMCFAPVQHLDDLACALADEIAGRSLADLLRSPGVAGAARAGRATAPR